jgi:histidinol-phosphatase (PHP family)
LIEEACKNGLKEMAITDHYDPDFINREFPFELDIEGYHKALNEAKEKYKNRIKIIRGVEIGIQHGGTIEKCRAAANSFDYDFILGSFHFAESLELHNGRFMEGHSAEDSYIAYYSYLRDCLSQYKDYDILGHINYIDRYTERLPDPAIYRDLVEDIFRNIIADGIGIEINTSSFRYGMGERTTPTKGMLQLYKDLGGEIITIGSDAHRTNDLGCRFRDAVEMIKTAGIKYLTTFEQRKPNFISLDLL